MISKFSFGSDIGNLKNIINRQKLMLCGSTKGKCQKIEYPLRCHFFVFVFLFFRQSPAEISYFHRFQYFECRTKHTNNKKISIIETELFRRVNLTAKIIHNLITFQLQWKTKHIRIWSPTIFDIVQTLDINNDFSN